MRTRRDWLAYSVVALVCAAGPATATANEGPYCGVYSVFAALKLHNSPVELRDLLDKRYVPSTKGSGLDDLCQAIRDHGGRAVPLTGIGEAALRASPDPVILHVRRPGYLSGFDHWVLYLGCDGDLVRVLDPPGDAQEIPFAELLAVWDGVGIVVEGQAGSSWEVQAGGRVMLIGLLAVLVVSLAAVRWIAPGVVRRRWSGLVLIPAVTLAAALTCHAVPASGFLRTPGAVGEVARRYFDAELPTISVEEFAALVGRPDVTIIDCRLESNYQRGHVPGAISLPIVSNTAERAQVLAGVPAGRRLVVYCQSEMCLWARQVAGDLYHRGYRDNAVFRAGWVGWKNYEREDRAAGR